MNLVENKKSCCACAVCHNICPQNAIEMKEDEFGFVYPSINNEKCIGCGLCERMCGYKNKDKQLYTPKQVYAAQAKNNEWIKNSSSGRYFCRISKRNN